MDLFGMKLIFRIVQSIVFFFLVIACANINAAIFNQKLSNTAINTTLSSVESSSFIFNDNNVFLKNTFLQLVPFEMNKSILHVHLTVEIAFLLLLVFVLILLFINRKNYQKQLHEIFDVVVDLGRRFRQKINGYALGSGNSIPEFVPLEGYMAMIRAAQALRAEEEKQ